MSNKHGSKWITRKKRLAIYGRDDMCCCYCGAGLEDGISLTLDHVICRNHGGSHHETNLVTACGQCNTNRGDRPVEEFCEAVAGYINHGITGSMIMDHINATRAQPLAPFIKQAEDIIAKRPVWNKALQEANARR